MLGLSQTTGYAARLLASLDDPGGRFVQTSDLAGRFAIPEAYLRKVVTRLVGLGLIASRRGTAGGIMLRRPAREISLFSVAQAMEPPGWDQSCFLGLGACLPGLACAAHQRLEGHRQEVLVLLRDISIADMAPSLREGPRAPHTHL